MGIYNFNYKAVVCIIIHRNVNVEIEYFLEEQLLLVSKAMGASQQFHLNAPD